MEQPQLPPMDEKMGGRRHKGSKKMHKGKRHGNASLRAWVTFVKKVQKEEGIGYKEAMSVAKKRKDGGEKWRGGGNLEPEETDMLSEDEMTGGRRRRRRTHKRRGSRKHRGTRRHRR
jgi:hypothetical protein